MAKYRILQQGDTFLPQQREFCVLWFVWFNLAYCATQPEAEFVIKQLQEKDEAYKNRKVVKTY
jgi:hypothetical protein